MRFAGRSIATPPAFLQVPALPATPVLTRAPDTGFTDPGTGTTQALPNPNVGDPANSNNMLLIGAAALGVLALLTLGK